MEVILRKLQVSLERGLFRAATASQVLRELAWPGSGTDCCNDVPLAQVSIVDHFISHSWSCSSRLKYLMICHYLNYDRALCSSSCTALLAVGLLFLRAGSFEGIAREGPAFLCIALFCCPLAIFVMSYFGGHMLQPGTSQTLWFDRLCVNQHDVPVKAMTLQAIPAFVAQAKNLLAELINSMLLSALCFQKLQQHQLMLQQLARFDFRNGKCSIEGDRQVIQAQIIDLFDEALEAPLSMSFEAPGVGEDVEMVEDPLISVETLRAIRHVTSYPTNEEIIDEFNAYVKGPLQQDVLLSIAAADEFSWKLYLIMVLPTALLGLVRVLGCDGHTDCQIAASYVGYASTSQYMVTNGCIWFILGPIFSIMSIPVLLRTNHMISEMVAGHAARMFLGSICGTVLQFGQDAVWAALSGALVVVVTMYSSIWLAVFIGGFVLSSIFFCVFVGRFTLRFPCRKCRICACSS
eukprot:Skav216586  [mRNA]  locus=scaffold3151:147969:152421:+ [translate_table: standard]